MNLNKLRTEAYNDPKKAYEVMNQWTRIKTDYELMFSDKNVTKVDLILEEDKPRFASVYYTTSTSRGVSSIDLSSKILLDKPDTKNIVSKLSESKK